MDLSFLRVICCTEIWKQSGVELDLLFMKLPSKYLSKQ